MMEYKIYKTRHTERGFWAVLEMKHKENDTSRIHCMTQKGLIIKTEIQTETL
jgi:hypothetical protein